MTWVAGALAIVSCALWALLPVQRQDHPQVAGTRAETSASTPLDEPSPAIDERVFAAAIWSPAPGDEAALDSRGSSRVTAQPQARRFELIAIIDEGEQRRAALYDTSADRIRIVRDGDRIEGHTVIAVSADAVELSFGQSIRRLTLEEDRS
ncbi:MAG: hypothetical protein ACYS0G_03705 [Planctomycetota bacterium]|jgi:hypothetical protein